MKLIKNQSGCSFHISKWEWAVFLIVIGIIGWAFIEALIYIFSHVSVSFH